MGGTRHMTTISEDWLDELDKLEKAATPGPWGTNMGNKDTIDMVWHEGTDVAVLSAEPKDCALVAVLRSHARELIDMAKANGNLRKLLLRMEHMGGCECFFCGYIACVEGPQHEPNCELAEALTCMKTG